MRKENEMESLVYRILLSTDGRTTDILEAITNQRVSNIILKQEYNLQSKKEKILRESITVINNTDLVLSHNIVIINTDAIPNEIIENVVEKQNGIGKSIRGKKIATNREVISKGIRDKNEVYDLFKNKCKLKFNFDKDVPYKEYKIYFQNCEKCGMHILEYFNRDLLMNTDFEYRGQINV